MSRVELRPAGPDDAEYVEELLAENDLPTADLDSAYSSLLVCEVSADERVGGPEGKTVGVGGLEVEGDAGLLRSVAVEESARGAGYGTAICDRLLDRARTADLDAVVLLTTTAADFFAAFDFEEIDRSRVPDSIRETAEFTDLCPTSATCMRRDLA